MLNGKERRVVRSTTTSRFLSAAIWTEILQKTNEHRYSQGHTFFPEASQESQAKSLMENENLRRQSKEDLESVE